ncbi:ion transporter [Dokdonia donghaensis]|uniref:Ion transporter n=1 Tax=Dokdonia donghaensis DSW-1 TaxID=1300343 RepID=A0A0A2H0P4_9FLAO|nr:ion transporter [Dokdonia donghaensis]ANH61628.1 Cyclic nucleotide-gated potassium channel [Dokdonia donghaensis DSW-1]KGO06225.1 ion transporter [Dokdonia donghaensis DSW-1]
MTKDSTSPWRKKLHDIIYEADTPAGKLFDVVLLILILASIALVMLESVKSIDARFHDYFEIGEWIITIFFTLEYFARIVTIKKPSTYIFSFYGLIDFFSTIPQYLAFFFIGSNALLTVRALRLLRVFRILKITRYVGESNKLSRALKDSRAKISIFLFAVLILCIIAGTIMYMVEGEESGFTSIPVSVYWCIVTLTTVGFGDIAPVTPLGQFIAALIMILGYGIIAVPTGIVSAEYAKDMEPSKVTIDGEDYVHMNTQCCQNCNAKKHRDDAEFCHKCGNSLDRDF